MTIIVFELQRQQPYFHHVAYYTANAYYTADWHPAGDSLESGTIPVEFHWSAKR
jgi:hypothetical protein